MEWLRSRCGFDSYVVVDSIGRRGGLALLWMNEANVEVMSFSNQHIDARIGETNREVAWTFTSFYRSPIVGIEENHGTYYDNYMLKILYLGYL